MARLNSSASPSASTRHTRASTRSGAPSGGTNSNCTIAPVFNLALVLTFVPCMLMSTDLARYRFVPALTMTGQVSRIRGCRRRSCRGGRGMNGHECFAIPGPERRRIEVPGFIRASGPGDMNCTRRAWTSFEAWVADAPRGLLCLSGVDHHAQKAVPLLEKRDIATVSGRWRIAGRLGPRGYACRARLAEPMPNRKAVTINSG